MVGFFKRYGKYVAIVIMLTLLVSEVPMFINSFKLGQVIAGDNDNENKIAADISNMTGVKAEEIMKLRNTGKSWNEVLDKVKSTMYEKDDIKRRDEVLTNDVLDSEFIDKLEKEGFSKEKVFDAKLRVERLIYDIKEITSSDNNVNTAPIVDSNLVKEKDKDKESIDSLSQLSEKLDIKTAVYLMIRLEKEFGSFDKVLDEYLLSLQLELNLEEYFFDKKNYEKEKAEKSALHIKEIVTLAKIEELLLSKVQEESKKENTNNTSITSTNNINKNTEVKSPLPENPIPEIKDVKPQNPVNEIMKEIQTIDPMKNGGK